MKQRKRKLNTSIFLMEMIMVCGFLMISASLCVRGFGKANEISRRAEDKGKAVILAQSYAEDFKSGREFKEIQEMNISVNYDKDWIETSDEKEVKYTCRLNISDLEESTNIKEMNIGVYEGGDMLYDLTVSRFDG